MCIRDSAYLTGFRGSGGVALVDDDGEAVLCTDSRYELQVVEQAPDVGHVISREYVSGVLGRRRGPADAPLAAAPGATIAVPRELTAMAPGWAEAFAAAVDAARDRGFRVVEIDLAPFLAAARLLYDGALVALSLIHI